MNIMLFRIVVGLLSIIPLIGVVIGYGPGVAFLMPEGSDFPARLDNQFRYLSGVYLGVTGAALWAMINPAKHLAPIRIACLGVFAGGIGRVVSMVHMGPPDDMNMIVGVGIELVLVPLMLLWQTRIAANAA